MNIRLWKLGASLGTALALVATGCTDEPMVDNDAGPGTPSAVIEATEVAFGQVDCGGTATRDVVIENKGNGLLTFSTSVTGTRFSAAPAEGSVPAGGSATVKVTAVLPATMSAGTGESGVLTIVTNDVKKATSTLNLSAQSAGVTLSLIPSVASFGVLPVQTSTPALPLTLRNDGNVPATLAFVQPTDGQFVVSWTGAPQPVTVDPGQSVPGLSAVFSPTTTSPSASAVEIVTATAVCGASVASIPMTGQGSSGAVGLSTTDVFFGDNGLVDCGTLAGAQTFKLTNSGNQAFAWTATLGKGSESPFTFSPANGLLPANGGEVEITVTPTAVPQVASTETNAFGDVLLIATDVPGDEAKSVTLHQTARGVSLRFSEPSVDFGLVPTFSTATGAVSLVNDGNVTVEATLTSSNPLFVLDPAEALVVDGGAEGALVATFAPGASIEPQQSAVSVAIDEAVVLCAPLPEPLSLTGTGLGAPRANFAAEPLDFEAVGCGQPATRTLALTNDGEVPLTFSAQITGQRFSVSPAEGSVPPGETLDVEVTASFPSTSLAGTAAQGVLTLATNDENHLTTNIDLSATSSGATLTLTPKVASFGVYPVAIAAAPIELELRNTGNAPAVLTFDQPADAQFSVSWAGAPAAVTVAPGAAVPDLAAGFTASAITLSQTQALIHVDGAVCGESAATLRMTGQGTAGSVGFSTTDVFFGEDGFVDCGTQAGAQKFRITNSGNGSFSWTATLGKGDASGFSFSPTSGTVPAGGSQEITVTPTAGIPQTATTAADAFGDTLIFDTDVPDDPDRVVNLRQTARGVALRFEPAAVDFGHVPTYDSATRTLTLVNDGNVTATASLAVTNDHFALSSTTGIEVTGNESVPLVATFTPDGSVVAEAADVAVTLDAPAVLCSPLPAPATLSGTGTLGVVVVSTDEVDFGQVSCGTTAEPKEVVFSNPGNQDYTVEAFLGLGEDSPFTIELDPSSGLVAANGGTLTITVTPSAIPAVSAVTPNLYGDTLAITTDVPLEPLRDIPLRQTASGSIFVINATSLNFGSVPAGATGTAQFRVTNNGNAEGGLSVTPPAGDVFTFADVTFGGQSSKPMVGEFRPTAVSEFSSLAEISVTEGTVLCQPLPHTQLSLQGRGTDENVIALSTSSLSFGTGGFVDCGTQASNRTLTITNNSSEEVTVQAVLGLGAASPFTVGEIAPIPAGSPRTVVVTPKAIPAVASTVPDAFGDTLTLTFTGSVVSEEHVVNLHQTARGAVLSFFPTSLSFVAKWGQSDSEDFTLSNTGNLAAPFTLSLGGAHTASYSVTPSAGTVDASGSAAGTVTFSVAGLSPAGSRPGTMSVAVDGATTLCAPLPASVTLNGTAQAL